MGKAGRFACIFVPMALTIASLICLIIVGLGGTNRSDSTLNNLYFFRANTSHINVSPSDLKLPNLPSAVTDQLGTLTSSAAKSALNIKDFYHVSLWNYCSGDFSNSTSGAPDHVTFCSPHQAEFWFNPVEIWGLNNTGVDKFFSTELKAGLNTYRVVAKWMFIAYVIALVSTIVEILVGFFALFSRLGSVITTIVSTISSLFLIAFALTATILYSTLTGTFNGALTKYDIHGSLGHSIYVTIWLGVAFSLASGLFWMFSSCCCSGRSNRIKGYGDEAPRRGMQAHQYERVESPARGGLPYGVPQKGYQAPYGHHMNSMDPQKGTAYEPFRRENV